MNNMDNAIQYLIDSKERLLKYLQGEVDNNPTKYTYETFGKEIESPLVSEIISILNAGGLLRADDAYDSMIHKSVIAFLHRKTISVRKTRNALKRLAVAKTTITKKSKLLAYRQAKNKNKFPDLTLLRRHDIAIEIKAGNRSAFDEKKKVWVKCHNSNNDLGTLESWPSKILEFGGENIYFLFLEYDFTSGHKKIIDIKIDHFYRFVGLNEDGFLSYREKDGNLRPKNFDEPAPLDSFEDFQALFQPTVIYRAKRIIQKHIDSIPDAERNDFLSSLMIGQVGCC
jgi:hypothetical protein